MADVCGQTRGDAARDLGDQFNCFISLHRTVGNEVDQRAAGGPLANDRDIVVPVVTGLEDIENAN